MRKNVKVVAMLAAIASAGLGCNVGGGSKSADSPKAVGEIMVSAMKAGDWASLYDVFGAEARKEMDAQLDKMNAAVTPEAREQTKKMMGFDPADLKGMPKREAFAKLMEGMMHFAAQMAKTMGAKETPDFKEKFAKAKVADSSVDGDKGTVTIDDGTGKTSVIEVVKEADGWKLVKPPEMQ